MAVGAAAAANAMHLSETSARICLTGSTWCLTGIWMLLCNSVWTADTCLLANGGCFVAVDKQQVELCVMLPLS